MADISKVQLPNSTTIVNIKDEVARTNIENITLNHTYDSVLQNVILNVGSLVDADTTEY